jgi:hypothetical protein
VSGDTNEMTAGYTRKNPEVNGSHSLPGHHVNAMTLALRAGDVKARSRVCIRARAARSAAALYVAEHSSTIEE